MDFSLQFFVFLGILLTFFALMQWYVFRRYTQWLNAAMSLPVRNSLFWAAIVFLVIGNITFVLRFPSTALGLYQEAWFQSLVIYPGGLFYGIIFLSFVLLLAVDALRYTWRAGMWAKQRIGSARARRTDAGSIETTSSPEQTSQARASAKSLDSAAATSSPVQTPDEPATAAGLGSTAATSSPEPFSSSQGLLSRRAFLRTSGAALAGAPFVLTIGASAATAHDYQIVRKKLHFPTLPSAFEGLRIVHLSDIHSGIFMTEQQMRDIFQLSNEQQPDLVMITGDFVDNSVAEIPALYRALPELRAGLGIYGSLGNHDHYADAAQVSAALQGQGVRVLTNAHETLTIGSQKLTLAGIDDAGPGEMNFARMDQATAGMPQDGFKIMLSHRPGEFDQAMEHGIDLMLAGHTHGGQIGFELPGGLGLYPIRLFHRYAKGLYEVGAHKIYVNVGIGMVGVPVRTVRPELTVLELTARA